MRSDINEDSCLKLPANDRRIIREIGSRRLQFGPYVVPNVKVGDELSCALSGLQIVAGWHGPKQWPRVKSSGWPRLIVCGDLLRALSLETCATVALHWGIHTATVINWRRRLGLNSSVTAAASIFKAAHLRTAMSIDPGRWVEPAVCRFKNLTFEERRQLGIRAAGTRVWTELDLKRLCELDNKSAAIILGRSLSSVANARQRFKIPLRSRVLTCERCNYQWMSVKQNLPKTCANQVCRSPFWRKSENLSGTD